ncbi:flavin reductase family protein [Ancylobacter lacus]|uniref:flavin reductase family protein n=1 Tax=Ancylobacter lacus TaxID=2579970 RepID=UPI001BCCE030|nr:flavin reductase family protein [Ancylobacter lacus]MBS7538926.1 flavin reductase [Ancylobacter lacus]
MSIDPALFRDAMGRTASGVTVVTTAGEAGRAGLTVSSLCSLSMEPPSVLFCVHRDSRSLPAILANGVFAANILGHDQHRVADSFAGLIPEWRDDRFAAGTWDTRVTGAPLLHGALCRFDCRVAGVFAFGTHHIVAGEVVAVETHAEEPLVYTRRGYRRLASA